MRGQRIIVVACVVAGLVNCGGGSSHSSPPTTAPTQPWPVVVRTALNALRFSEREIGLSLAQDPVATTAAVCKNGLGAIEAVREAVDAVGHATIPSSVDVSGTLRQQQGSDVLWDWLKTVLTAEDSYRSCASGVLFDPQRVTVDIRAQVEHPYAWDCAMTALDLWDAGRDIPNNLGTNPNTPCTTH